jgi:NADPH-dependent curcumin reductase CurA
MTAVAALPRTTRAVVLVSRPGERGPAPADFRVEEIPIPELAPGQVLVRNSYMSVDPSMRGRLEQTEKHYTTNFGLGEPLDGSAIGTVLASRADDLPVGTALRHRRGWREHAVVDGGDLTDSAIAAKVDADRAPLSTWLGVLGQTGFTAYVGLVRAAEMRPGDVVFVSAAAGAVGSAAGQFARLLGASRVVGSAGGVEKRRLLTEELGYDDAIDYRGEDVRAGLARTVPDGIDVYFDNVGGDHLVAALDALRLRGRVALCGMISQFDTAAERPSIDHVIQAVLKRLTLRGFIVRDHADLRREFEDRVIGWMQTGELVSRETVVDGLDHAVDAFLGMLGGGNVGKMLVRLDADDPVRTGSGAGP